jgi:hypothetical protein
MRITSWLPISPIVVKYTFVDYFSRLIIFTEGDANIFSLGKC